MSNKPTKIGDVNCGESVRMLVRDGKLDKSMTSQPVKPSNVVPPQKLPIPPASPNNSGGDKK